MTAFQQGQIVRSRVTAQGLVKGDLYRVTSVGTWHSPFGTFVTYFVQPVDSATEQAKQESLPVGNGHLVLEVA